MNLSPFLKIGNFNCRQVGILIVAHQEVGLDEYWWEQGHYWLGLGNQFDIQNTSDNIIDYYVDDNWNETTNVNMDNIQIIKNIIDKPVFDKSNVWFTWHQGGKGGSFCTEDINDKYFDESKLVLNIDIIDFFDYELSMLIGMTYDGKDLEYDFGFACRYCDGVNFHLV